MANHENYSSNNNEDSDDSLNLWRTELTEAQGEPLPTDSTELLQALQDDGEDQPKDAVELLRQAYDENEAAESSSNREQDLRGLERLEHRFTRLRKFGDKLLSIFTKREVSNKAERREAQKQLAGKIGNAALETAKKTATFAIETATKAAVEAAMGR